MPKHGCQVKGSLVLVIPEVQMLHPQPHIFLLIYLFLKCLQPFSCYWVIHIDELLPWDLHSLSGCGMAQLLSQANDK